MVSLLFEILVISPLFLKPSDITIMSQNRDITISSKNCDITIISNDYAGDITVFRNNGDIMVNASLGVHSLKKCMHAVFLTGIRFLTRIQAQN